MSLHLLAIPPIPEETVRVAQAVFPKGNVYMRMRDELGTIYRIRISLTSSPKEDNPLRSPGAWRW